MAVRERGDWEGWLRFFLDGVRVTAEEAARTAGAIVVLRDEHRATVAAVGNNALRLLDHLYTWPLVRVAEVREVLGISFPTASKLVMEFTQRVCSRS